MRVLCKKCHQSQIISAPTHFCCFVFLRSSFLQLATDLQLFYYNQRMPIKVINYWRSGNEHNKGWSTVLVNRLENIDQFLPQTSSVPVYSLFKLYTHLSLIHSFFLKTRLYKVWICNLNRIGCVVFIPLWATFI